MMGETDIMRQKDEGHSTKKNKIQNTIYNKIIYCIHSIVMRGETEYIRHKDNSFQRQIASCDVGNVRSRRSREINSIQKENRKYLETGKSRKKKE